MRKLFLAILLLFTLTGCTAATTTITYPEMSYLSFSRLWINSVENQLTQEEDVYYLYFTSEGCGACQNIKNEALYTIEFLKEDTVYFVFVDESGVDSSISITGTPSIVRIENGAVDEITTGGSSVLEVLRGLN